MIIEHYYPIIYIVKEVVKYSAENTGIEYFMRPPTESLGADLMDACTLIEQKINKVGERVAYTLASTEIKPNLSIGSEIELLLFSQDFDPSIHRYGNADDEKVNPNYSRKHLKAVREIMGGIHKTTRKGGIADVLYAECPTLVRRIFAEVRTRPSDVLGYSTAMSSLQSYFQRRGGMTRPVVHSQHFHCSLTSASGFNLLCSDRVVLAIKKGIIDSYQRFLPLVMLPEEVEEENQKSVGLDSGVRLRGSLYGHGYPRRIEGRLSSSEYMFDPYVNLLVHLIGVARGLEHTFSITDIDADRKLQFSDDYDVYYFTTGANITNYQDEIGRMMNDPVLPQFLNRDLIQKLAEKAQLYWDISKGNISVADARHVGKSSCPL